MSNIGFNQPKEFQYEKEHIELLLSDLETDYYDRYNFNDLQQYIYYIQGDPGGQTDQDDLLDILDNPQAGGQVQEPEDGGRDHRPRAETQSQESLLHAQQDHPAVHPAPEEDGHHSKYLN